MKFILLVKNNRGFSIVQVLVAASILLVVMLALSSFMADQYKMVGKLSRKLEILNATSLIQSTLVNSKNCTCILRPNNVSSPGNLWFNSTNTSGTEQIILDKIPSGCDPSSVSLVEKGKPLSSMFGDLLVQSVLFKNIKPTGSINEWIGSFEISFNQPVLPIVIQQRFLVEDSPASLPTKRIILSCVSTNTLALQDYETLSTNTVQIAPCDSFISFQIGGALKNINEHGYICAGTDKNNVSECYGHDGGGPGASTILTRAIGYSGSMALVKKGYYFQGQFLGGKYGSGGLYGWEAPGGSMLMKRVCIYN